MLSCVASDGESKPPVIAARRDPPPSSTGEIERAGPSTRSHDERYRDDRGPREPAGRSGPVAPKMASARPDRRGPAARPPGPAGGLLDRGPDRGDAPPGRGLGTARPPGLHAAGRVAALAAGTG